MERPTDTYKRTHGLVLKPRDSVFGGQVSRLQVAELIAACAASPGLAENKCLEVVAEEGARAPAVEDLLAAVPAEVSRVSRGRGRGRGMVAGGVSFGGGGWVGLGGGGSERHWGRG
jgi:hypothetical protein